MKTKEVIVNLRELVELYTPLWDNWIKNEACSLNEDDLYIINIHKKNNYKLNLFDSFMFYNQSEHIVNINGKLKRDLKRYKQWVILNFLFSIVEMARKNGGQHYLHIPIGILEISAEHKSALFKLNILYLNQIFEKYKEEDFEKEKIFNSIIEFETANGQKEFCTMDG